MQGVELHVLVKDGVDSAGYVSKYGILDHQEKELRDRGRETPSEDTVFHFAVPYVPSSSEAKEAFIVNIGEKARIAFDEKEMALDWAERYLVKLRSSGFADRVSVNPVTVSHHLLADVERRAIEDAVAERALTKPA